MRYYLKRHDGTWSDLGDYPETPAHREEGVWVEGEPPKELPVWEETDILKVLSGMVAAIPTSIIRVYGTDVNLANNYLAAGNVKGAIEFIGYIWDDAQASGNPEHITAIQPIIEFLQTIGALK